MGVIYLRTNKVNGKQYVGQVTTKRFKARQNKWKSNSYRYAGKAINNARAKYGIDAFDFEILKECDDKELDFWEMYYIKELNTKVPNGYNMTDGGEGRSGSSVSKETRKKMSEYKGEKRWNYGKHLSEEHKKNLSESHKGQTSGMKNKKHTEESKRKMSENKKGIPNIKLSKPVFQIDKNTNNIIAEFSSLSEIERQLGLSFKNISCCCRGITKSAYGYIWKYKESAA